MQRPHFSRRGALAGTAGLASLVSGWPFARKSAYGQTPPGGQPSVLNIGLNVTDIERSIRFYVDALGFEDAGKVVSHPPNAARVFFGTGGEAFLKAHHVRMGQLLLLLRQFDDPKYVGTTDGHPTHQIGMCNISVRVDSIGRVTALMREYGGSVFENTYVKRGTNEGNGGVGMIFGTDPDGIQIELVEF